MKPFDKLDVEGLNKLFKDNPVAVDRLLNKLQKEEPLKRKRFLENMKKRFEEDKES